MKKKIVTWAVIGAIVIGGSSFYGGMKYAEGYATSGFRGGAFQRGAGTGRFGGIGAGAFAGGRGGFATGRILSKDNKSITVKLPDGGSQIVFLATTTEVMKTASSTVSDLTVGDAVMVNGTPNSDGSMTARTIQLRSN